MPANFRTLAAVLRSPRDPEKLVIDVADMRRRIAEENPRPSPWDLRNRRGGLIDLEFIVQYLMLRHAASSPQILRRATTEAIAALGEAGLLPPQAQHELGEAATLFRNVQAVLTLLADGSPASAALWPNRMPPRSPPAWARLTSPGSTQISPPPRHASAAGTIA